MTNIRTFAKTQIGKATIFRAHCEKSNSQVLVEYTFITEKSVVIRAAIEKPTQTKRIDLGELELGNEDLSSLTSAREAIIHHVYTTLEQIPENAELVFVAR